MFAERWVAVCVGDVWSALVERLVSEFCLTDRQSELLGINTNFQRQTQTLILKCLDKFWYHYSTISGHCFVNGTFLLMSQCDKRVLDS